jgi:hypothetical protein
MELSLSKFSVAIYANSHGASKFPILSPIPSIKPETNRFWRVLHRREPVRLRFDLRVQLKHPKFHSSNASFNNSIPASLSGHLFQVGISRAATPLLAHQDRGGHGVSQGPDDLV